MIDAKITCKKLIQIESLQVKLGSLFENMNSSNWINEIRLITKEAAAFLGIFLPAFRIKAHRGKIEAEKLDQKLRFRISGLLSSFSKMEE